MYMFHRGRLFYGALLILGFLCQCKPQNPWFEEIKDAGLDFENQVTESDQDNAIDFLYVYNGGGVGIADINGDQLPDLCFTGNQSPGKLYLNKGNFSFEDITQYLEKPITGWCTGVSWADLNQDSFPDLIIARSGNGPKNQRTNLVYLNPGKIGSIWREVSSDIGLTQEDWTTQTLWFDFDRDGDLDGYLLNASNEERYSNRVQFDPSNSGSASDRLMVNQFSETGRLYFEDQTKACGILDNAFGLGITMGDFNQDGWPDLYVANDFLGHDLIYLNTGQKSFREVSKDKLPYSSHFSMGCTILDVNYDGLDDVFVADMLPSASDRRLRMTGPLSNESMQYVQENGYHKQFMRNTLQVQLNQRFIEVAQAFNLDQTDWSWSPVAADFSNDGLTDLFISNGYPKDITDMDFIAYNAELGQKEGRSKADQLIKTLIQKQPSHAAENFLYAGDANTGFRSIGWTGEQDVSNGAIEADLDGDGALDLIINRLNAPAQIWRNTIAKKESHFLMIDLKGSKENPLVHGTRIDVFFKNKVWTRYHQPVRGYQSSSLGPLHVGLGEVEVVDSIRVTWPDGKIQVLPSIASGKRTIQRDERNVRKSSPARLSDPESQPSQPVPLVAWEPTALQQDQQAPVERKGDWDGDGLPDVFLGGTLDRKTQVRFGNRSIWVRPENTPQWITDVTWADLNHDGLLDLILGAGGWMFERNSTFAQNEVWYQQSNHTFKKGDIPFGPFPTRKCLVQDFDQNGFLDVLVFPGRWLHHYGDWEKPVIWRQFGNNQWRKQETQFPPGFYTDALWSTVGEGWAVGELQGILKFTYNKNKGFEWTELPQSRGLWQCVAEVERGKIVFGNWGINTALKSGPAYVWLEDWDGNTLPDPVWVGPDKTFLHFREDLLKQLPMLKKIFPTYQKYAEAKAIDFPEWVGKSGRNWIQIDELRTMFWDGKTLKPLAGPAQWGILRSIEVLTAAKWLGTFSDSPLHVMNRGGGGVHTLHGQLDQVSFPKDKKIAL